MLDILLSRLREEIAIDGYSGKQTKKRKDKKNRHTQYIFTFTM